MASMKASATTAPTRLEFLGQLLRRPWRHPWSGLAVLVLVGAIAFAVFFVGGHIWAEVHYRAALRSVERATSSQTQENLKKALEHLRICLQIRTTSPETHFLAARTARRLSLYDE